MERKMWIVVVNKKIADIPFDASVYPCASENAARDIFNQLVEDWKKAQCWDGWDKGDVIVNEWDNLTELLLEDESTLIKIEMKEMTVLGIESEENDEVLEINSDDTYESVMITLTPTEFPKAFKEKVDELMEEGMFDNREEAEAWVTDAPIELELYYEKGNGLFGVESGFVESVSEFTSPYGGVYKEGKRDEE